MTNGEIIELLELTGHLKYPFGKQQSTPRHGEAGYSLLEVGSAAVQNAIASYQDFMVQNLDPLALYHHSRPLRCDGDLGPATRQLMAAPRCGCPDYGPEVQPAVGTGSWKKCHDIGNFHAATVKVDPRGMPSFLKPKFDEVWARNVAAYEELGLRWIRTEGSDRNIDFSFVSSLRDWIGLAIVGQNQSCGSRIWCKYLARYRPSNIVREWATLVMHELGHNAGLMHTRGGVMNPGIINGLPASWKNDPAESILKRYYGGEPIPDGPDTDEYWVKQTLESNRGRKVLVPLIPPLLVDEEESHA